MKQLPYGAQTPKTHVEPARAWCQAQWGPRWEVTGNQEGTWAVFWAGRSIPGYYQWWFETEQQQMLFVLKWAR